MLPEFDNDATTTSVIEANKQFFNDFNEHVHGESDVDKLLKLPSVQSVYTDLTNEILKAYPFDADKTRLLDFACGNGEMSLRLSSHCKAITGADISEKMVQGFKIKMDNNGVRNAAAVCGELKPGSLDGAKFDVIICLQAYHHINDCSEITKVLKSFLAPGGALLVVDLLKGTEHMPVVLVETLPVMQEMMKKAAHPHHVLPHAAGFSKEEMKELFEGAGLVDFEFAEAVTREREGKVFTVFLAKGVNVA